MAAVSVLVPVLNESKTIATLVSLLRTDPSVQEVLVVDDGSVDNTADLAAKAGARVLRSTLLGKGTSMEDGLRVARGDVVLYVDGDLLEVCPDLVKRMTAPILDGGADMVKARFDRSAGRVTLLTARPLLAAFFPELADFAQPLGGIVAARAAVLRNIHFENDYGVDVGLLIDATMRGARVAEANIGWIDHESQSLDALSEMARQVTRVILDRAWRHGRLTINQVREMEEAERRTRSQLLPTPHGDGARGRFALFDMDGVLLDGRFVVELAERVGARRELSRLLDNLTLPEDERAAVIASLFSGVSQDTFEETARSIPLCPGAVEAVIGLRREGYRVGIVTDSYFVAAETVRKRVFADFAVAHLMRFHNRVATGDLIPSPAMTSPTGCALHRCCKGNAVRRLRASAGLVPEQSLAIGDGENDICMFKEMGRAVAFRPKSAAVARAADFTLTRSLIDLLDLSGVTNSETATGGDRDTETQTSPKGPLAACLA